MTLVAPTSTGVPSAAQYHEVPSGQLVASSLRLSSCLAFEARRRFDRRTRWSDAP
jgi:hypothetical protein